MPRRSILSTSEQASLTAFPESPDELIQHYTLNEADMALVRQRRGDANRLGFAVQLCMLRYPGYGLAQHKGYPTPDHLAALAAYLGFLYMAYAPC
jgi:TnpA family transposase